MVKEKRTLSGPLLEIDLYPVFASGRKIPARAPKTQPSTEAQKKYNQTQATKKMVRLVNTNFDKTDYFMHPTYQVNYAPASEEQARKDINNYLRRVKARREKEAKKLKANITELRKALRQLPDNKYFRDELKSLRKKYDKLTAPMKYIYVIESSVYKKGPYAGLKSWHFHMFVTGGLERAVMEEIWNKGMRTNCNNYQPEEFGPEAAAEYMAKDPQGKKRFVYSRNLDKPKQPQAKDKAISKRQMERIATERADDKSYWEKRYKGYKFIRCFSRFNSYNSRWYVTAIMYKDGSDVPDWKTNDWITTDIA